MRTLTILFLLLLASGSSFAQTKGEGETQNLVLITIDGLRWNEVFQGADSVLFHSENLKRSYFNKLTRKFWSETPLERRSKLMPFLWTTVANEGQVYGNRNYGNKVSVRNRFNRSFAGYNEIFTGYADPSIGTNDKIANPNTNVFEFINQQEGFRGKVAAFASWDRAPYYLNANRSNIFVNGGFEPLAGGSLTPLQMTLNNLQDKFFDGGQSRPDFITYLLAKEFLRIHSPRVMGIGFNWTDNAGHDGNYPLYLENIFSIDGMIADLWDYLQEHPQYRDKTTLVITVDHGRGNGDDWVAHGPDIKHSNETWFALLGPDIQALGEIKTESSLYQDQLAQTMAVLLGLNFGLFSNLGAPRRRVKSGEA